MVIVLIGVSGSGKTTVGKLLARQVGCPFHEGDDYHPAANKDKMRRGIPLTDEDRGPWLAAIRDLIIKTLQEQKSAVIACSALTRAYRDYLRCDGVHFVYLKGDYDLICRRLESRPGHFFNPALLESQFATLEEPRRAVVVEIAQNPQVIVREIHSKLNMQEAAESRGQKNRAC